MRLKLVRTFSLLAFIALFSNYGHARNQVSIDTVISDQFEETGTLRFYVDVQDTQGNVPRNLDPEDVSIQIDQKETVGQFTLTNNRELNEGSAVLLLIPAHGSFVAGGTDDDPGTAAFKQIVTGAQNFISTLGPQDFHAIRFFTEKGTKVNQPFTQDGPGAQLFLDREMRKVLNRAQAGENSGTSSQAPRLLRKYIKDILKKDFVGNNLPRRKVILLFTEGHDQSFSSSRGSDNASNSIIKEALKEAEYRNNTGVKLHVVGIEGFEHDSGLASFIRLAEQTGGTHFKPDFTSDDFQELADAFETMGDRILRQHIIDWNTQEWDGGEAEIRLTIKMDGNEHSDDITDVWPERPSTWVSTFFTIFFTLLGIVLFIFIILKIVASRKNRPVYEEDHGDSSLGARAVLLVIGGPNQGDEIFLTEEVTTFGRSDACEIQLDDPTMSRRHAAIRIDSMRFELSDIKSASGTFVNGRRIETCFLKDGDLIMLAETKMSFKLI